MHGVAAAARRRAALAIAQSRYTLGEGKRAVGLMLTERAAVQAKQVMAAADASGGGKLDRGEFFKFVTASKTSAASE
jgi:hypothetical protein